VRCATAAPQLTRGVREIYDFTIGDERFHIIVDHDRALPRSGPSPVSADVSVACDVQTLLMLDAGALTPARARRERGRTQRRVQRRDRSRPRDHATKLNSRQIVSPRSALTPASTPDAPVSRA
jgi:hypothetical protein